MYTHGSSALKTEYYTVDTPEKRSRAGEKKVQNVKNSRKNLRMMKKRIVSLILITFAMAFAVLCISRLFHGFSCKSERPVLFSKRMFNNKVGLLAFAAGLLLICAVLFIPGLHNLFKVHALTGTQVIWVFALPVASFVMIQFTKIFRLKKA